MSATPRLSVLMTVYNGGRFLAPAVDSVLASPFRDLEFVVVDNVSTDGSREWLRTVADPRVRLIENETNLGQTGALRRGLDACRAPLVARLDADDLSEPDRFARQVAALEADSRLALMGGQALTIDPDDRVLSKSRLPTDADEIAAVMTVANPFIHSAAMFRREAALAVGGYPADCAVAQDYALWSALLRAGWRLANLDRPVCRLRLHSGQVTASGLGAREAPEALAITAANQAWARGLPGPDLNAARALQALWQGGGTAAPDAMAAAATHLLAAPRLCSRGRARLALLLASGRALGLTGLRLRLAAAALATRPGLAFTSTPYKAAWRMLWAAA